MVEYAWICYILSQVMWFLQSVSGWLSGTQRVVWRMQWGKAQVSTGWLLVNLAKSEDLEALDMGGPQTNHGMSLEIANKFQLWIRSCESGPADELFVVSSRMCVGNPFCLWYPSIAWIEIRDDKLNRLFWLEPFLFETWHVVLKSWF